MNKSEIKDIIIKCECGTHLLQVQSYVEYHDDITDGSTRYHNDINLAMFSYGNDKPNLYYRFVIAFKYLWSGKMHADQIVMCPDEAKKLNQFLTENIL